MSNPLPISQPAARRGSPPNSIEPALYPGLADLRPHCARDGTALIDRAYRDAAALHKRVLDLEAELELYRPAPLVLPGCATREQAIAAGKRALVGDFAGEDLL